MPQTALDALLASYREQPVWLLAQAAEFECGQRKIIAQGPRGAVDLSAETARQYRHKAGNLHAVIAANEGLHAKGT